MSDQVDAAIVRANRGLNRVKIERRDRKLALRGTLPVKPGEPGQRKRRYIALGIYANPDGVKVAKAKAQKLESDLNLDRFNWFDWEADVLSAGSKSAQDWGKEFAQKKQLSIKPASYRANYEDPLKSLPNKTLSEELLRAHILSRSAVDSWTRKNDCMVYTALCKFAGISADFSDIRGNHKPKPVKASDLPSDEEIEQIWDTLSPGWQWIYGMLATYGLRPHEVFRIADHKGIASPTGKISILDDSKTGGRDVWPLPDKWRAQFNLTTVVLPDIRFEGRDNQQMGQRVSANLRGKLPHKPYALRHAWAIRSAVMGVPDSIAARWMGHSVAVHAETYHAAINQLQHEAIWRRANQLGNSI